MIEVQVLVIEDAPIDYAAVGRVLARATAAVGQEFVFRLHPFANAKVADDASVYRDYISFLSGGLVDAWGRLRGHVLAFVDLGLEVYESRGLTALEQDELYRILAGRPKPENRRFDRGLYLLVSALKNSDWEGVVKLATRLGPAEYTDMAMRCVKEKFPNKRVSLSLALGGLSTPNQTHLEKIVNAGVQDFVTWFSLRRSSSE